MTISPDIDRRFREAASSLGLVDLGYDVVDSPVGPLFVAVSTKGLAALSFHEQDDADLAAVARVDQPRRVHDRDPVPGGEAGARLDEACEPLRDGDREPCRNDRALAGSELHAFAGREVEAGVPCIRPSGQRCLLPQADDGKLDHASWTSAAGASASAIR